MTLQRHSLNSSFNHFFDPLRKGNVEGWDSFTQDLRIFDHLFVFFHEFSACMIIIILILDTISHFLLLENLYNWKHLTNQYRKVILRRRSLFENINPVKKLDNGKYYQRLPHC